MPDMNIEIGSINYKEFSKIITGEYFNFLVDANEIILPPEWPKGLYVLSIPREATINIDIASKEVNYYIDKGKLVAIPLHMWIGKQEFSGYFKEKEGE